MEGGGRKKKGDEAFELDGENGKDARRRKSVILVLRVCLASSSGT